MADLLEPLVATIEAIRARIATHGASLRQNETRTRTALIDPLLQALGWDTADPALVTPEYRVDVGWADYALISAGNKPAAVIEAKRLGSIVENHLEQAVGYCIQQGIAYAGVTDGNHWQLYRTFEPVPLVEKLVLDVTIADTQAHETALKLLLLWRLNLPTGQPVEAKAPILVDLRTDTPQAPDSLVPTTPASTTRAPDQSSSGHWIPLSKISPSDITERGNPKVIRFSNGYTRDIKNFRDALTETANYLAETGKITASAFPNHRLAFINSSPNSPGGTPYRSYKAVSGELYVNVNWNRSNLIKYSKRLLDHCGESPTTGPFHSRVR